MTITCTCFVTIRCLCGTVNLVGLEQRRPATAYEILSPELEACKSTNPLDNGDGEPLRTVWPCCDCRRPLHVEVTIEASSPRKRDE